MELSQISTGRTGRRCWFLEFVRTHRHVFVLSDRGARPTIQEIFVVEEVYDLDPTGKIYEPLYRLSVFS